MKAQTLATPKQRSGISALLADYLELCKPKVVLLILITAVVGMLVATPQLPPLATVIFATLGIGLAAGAAAVVNHVVDRRIDTMMGRTQKRPVASGRITPTQAIMFAAVQSIFAMWLLVTFVNPLTAILTFVTLIGYAGVYTIFLKHATPQNIVIGGATGAAPPMLGWFAVTGHFDPNALLLVLIIFTWTPPHFWALAIHKRDEYKRANVPMLPVTHGIRFTKLCVTLYTILLLVVSLLPYVVGMSSWLYLGSALALGTVFLYYALKLQFGKHPLNAIRTFKFSILYLLLLFIALLVDHFIPMF